MPRHLQADGTGGAERGPETGEHVPHEREMASTLAALAAAAPASGASGGPPGCGSLLSCSRLAYWFVRERWKALHAVRVT